MAEKQTSLFEDESFRRPEVGGLVVISQPGRPLSKAQRAFNRLVTKVEELRARLDREIHRLDKVLAYYGEHIHPRLQRQNGIAQGTRSRACAVSRWQPPERKKRAKDRCECSLENK